MLEILLLIAFGYAIGWVINHPEEAKKIWNRLFSTDKPNE